MIKGCQRRIIMVKDTGSDCFDAAYFVLRHDAPLHQSESDMLSEASRVIDACSVAGFLSSPRPARRRSSAANAIMLTAAAVIGLISGAGVMLLCLA